jgi:DNA-binding NtrC family response regulator
VTGRDTKGDTTRETNDPRPRTPGIVVAFSGKPHFLAFAAEGAMRVGRDAPAFALFDDERLSRNHAEIRATPRGFVVRDFGSRNGTFVDGDLVRGETHAGDGAIVRAGRTIMILSADVTPFVGREVRTVGNVLVGVKLADVLTEVERAASAGDALMVRGETGAGKEIAARRYHDASPSAAGPFAAFNCATIPHGLAERLLFGAKRGAYSGAMGDSDGVVQAADGGTLFLDEIGELDQAVQAKLLRVLETREVVPLGASRPRKVDVRFCFATHRDLRQAVAAGTFRADLFYRLGEHEVVLPALRERREDIPWLCALAAAEVDKDLVLHPRFVEACMMRPWPGNVRELLRETRRAAHAAHDAHDADVRDSHLKERAGEAIAALPKPVERIVETGPSEADVRAALHAADGNVSEAARALGMHRTQLRRTLDKLGITAAKA